MIGLQANTVGDLAFAKRDTGKIGVVRGRFTDEVDVRGRLTFVGNDDIVRHLVPGEVTSWTPLQVKR
jgi:hypothetical protein